MTAQPWLKFYPPDWRADPALRVCSLAARGLWMDMLCIMHEAEPRGYLKLNGFAVTPDQLAALVGASAKDILKCMVELERAGVFSRDNGIIFSRRMVRDTKKAAEDKANGKGGGNPGLKPTPVRGVNPPVKPEDNGSDKAQKLEARATDQNQNQIPKEDLNLNLEIGVSPSRVASVIKGALRKAKEDPSGCFLVPADSRLPQARQRWREHYGTDDIPLAWKGRTQGYRVPWEFVN